MKTIHLHKCVLLALALFLMGSVLWAQDETDELKKQEQMKAMQAEEMQARKDMLEDQQNKMQQLEQEYYEQAKKMEANDRESSRARELYRVRSSGRTFGDDTYGEYLVGGYSQGSQSQLTLRKSFRETTSTSKGEFEVDQGVRNFRCMISGSVRAGEIMIGIEYPDGKTFKELTINPSVDINFSQSVSIKEGEEKKFVGSWNYVIKADKADGNYMVQIMTQ